MGKNISEETVSASASTEIQSSKTQSAPVETEEAVFMPLQKFADDYALKYGIELMAGFFHTQESLKKFADIEENYHSAIKVYAKEEVK